MTIGNHEFDNGPAVLADYAKSLAFPCFPPTWMSATSRCWPGW
ncbi:hypothetical protein ACFQU7_14425 [Pseudoroseomonas wenyumeiae]